MANDFINDEIIAEFLNESREYQERLDSLLLELENLLKSNSEISSEITDELFRIAHTIKGSAGFLEFNHINRMMHAMESVMSEVRDGKLSYTLDMLDTFLDVSERLAEMLNGVEETMSNDVEADDLIERLNAFLLGGSKKTDSDTDKEDGNIVDNKEKPNNNASPEGKKEDKPHGDIEPFSGGDIKLIEDIFKKGEFFSLGGFLRRIDAIKNTGKYPVDRLTLLEDLVWKAMSSPDGNNEDMLNSIKDILNELINTENNDVVVAPNDDIDIDNLEFDGVLYRLEYRLNVESEMYQLKEELLKNKLNKIGTIHDIKELFNDDEGRVIFVFSSELDNKSIKKETLLDAVELERIDILIQQKTGSKGEKAKEADGNEKKKSTPRRTISEESIRVDLKKLDKLMNLSEELVIAKSFYNRLIQKLQVSISKESVDRELLLRLSKDFEESSHQLNLIADEIQTIAMKARMVPVGTTLNKFKRVVRDLAKKAGKEVVLEIFGEDTELDKKVVDSLGEPLTHLLRNSIDHGIEGPDERERVGKPRAGKIIIRAYNAGSIVSLEIRDDGRGIDPDVITKKAIEKGIITQEQALTLSREERLDLIFRPGFSTKDVATDLSGRGVGMDVVKRMIENVNGTLKLQTDFGKGTSIILNIPITLAIMKALLVKLDNFYYAFPLENVVEVVKLKPEEIIPLKGKKSFRIRDEVFFIEYLSNILGIFEENIDEEKLIILVNSGRYSIGVIVDELVGEEDIVIKSLKGIVAHIPELSGVSILGEGDLALILDIDYLIKRWFGVE